MLKFELLRQDKRNKKIRDSGVSYWSGLRNELNIYVVKNKGPFKANSGRDADPVSSTLFHLQRTHPIHPLIRAGEEKGRKSNLGEAKWFFHLGGRSWLV